MRKGAGDPTNFSRGKKATQWFFLFSIYLMIVQILSLKDREWVCPVCGKANYRDLNAAENVLRRGISELWSGCQTESDSSIHTCTQESHRLYTWEYAKLYYV